MEGCLFNLLSAGAKDKADAFMRHCGFILG